MLGPLSNSSSSRGRDEEVVAGPSSPHLDIGRRYRQYNLCSQPSSVLHTRQLLLNCAELISQSNLSAARQLVSVLSTKFYYTPYGDSSERLAHHFSRALSLRLGLHLGPSSVIAEAAACSGDPRELESCYLSLNQITPFVRFSHLTANQAILDAVNGGSQQSIHIIDFDIMHGLQWPPLMQALAERSPPPRLRITGGGSDQDALNRTADRLSKFAHSLGLPFRFHELHLTDDSEKCPMMTSVFPSEIVAVNLVMYLHRLIRSNGEATELREFLRQIRSWNPRIVTVAEREASLNHPSFFHRFVEALDHYSAVFDSLEATLPPKSRERLDVETVWFGREIADILAADGESRRQRHERFESWEILLRSSGFRNVPLSTFALRLHYPSEGYQLVIKKNSVLLGWQNRPLFSVSSWR